MLQRLTDVKFLFDEAAIRNAVKNRRMFQLLDISESMMLDLYPRELIEGELSRSELKQVFPGVHLPVASLVDAVLSKLIWIHKGSHNNRRDVRQMFARATDDQRKEIERLSRDQQVNNLLMEVLAESGIIE